jgi:hypothetical protein
LTTHSSSRPGCFPARIPLALLFGLVALAAAIPASAYEIHVNCGGQTYNVNGGPSFVPDRGYVPGLYGYVEGWDNPTWHTIGGTVDVPLYATTRNSFLPSGVLEYRFDVPNGPYLVTLHCAETFKHSTGENQFDVQIEGATTASNIDLYALVGGDYAVDFRAATTVSDGVLNVVMDPDFGFASLAAISVVSRASDTTPPDAPTGVTAAANYQGVALDWPDGPEDDILGYQVERGTSPGGPFFLVTSTPLRVSRFMDPASPGGPYYYRVTAIDVFGNASDPSDVASASSLAQNATSLPIVQLVVDPSDLEFLNDNPTTDTYVPCQIALGGQLFPGAQCRYRGNISRSLSKKSWKVKLPTGSVWQGRETFNYNGEFIDKSLMRSALSYELIERAGCPAPNVNFVHLVVNNNWMGVRTDVENVNTAFLTRVGLATENANLYKPEGLPELPPSNLVVLNSPADYQSAYSKELGTPGDYSDLIEFIQRLNYTSQDSLFLYISKHMNLDRLMQFYSTEVVLQNTDMTSKNWYLHHNLTTDKWTIFPWDTDLTFGNIWPFSPTNTATEPIYLGTINRLFGVIASTPMLRQLHFDRIRQELDTDFQPQNFEPLVDSMYAVAQTDVERDWWKWGWESNDWFHAQPAELKSFVPARAAYLQNQITLLEAPSDLAINEFMAANQTAVQDEWGEYDDWVEILNRGATPQGLLGLYLTDDPAVPGRFALPDTTLPPNGRALVWCDNQPLQGRWHAPFKLEQNGETVGLYSGPLPTSPPIDVKVFGPQYTDASFGRLPDGGPTWVIMPTPTPLATNVGGGNLRPQITHVTHFPPSPPANTQVRVTADLYDDGTMPTTEVRYDAGSGFVATALFDDGVHGDGAAGDGRYGAFIPGQPSSTTVHYYVRVVDNLGAITVDPAGAPGVFYTYTTGYVPPPLYLNEFMASNTTTIPDEHGEFDDWVEIWNDGPVAIDLGGKFMTDNLSNPTKWMFPNGVSIAPNQYLLVWCDNQPTQGPLHATFALSASGEQLGLFDSAAFGTGLIDSTSFGPQTPNVSRGRLPDGGLWQQLPMPSPGASNGTGQGVGDEGAPPVELAVHGPFPNPFSGGGARVVLDLPHSGPVELAVYDVTGRQIRRILAQDLGAGRHPATWDGRDARGARVASGVYWFRLRAGSEVRETRALLLR